MQKISQKNLEKNINIRQIEKNDIEEIVEFSQLVYGEEIGYEGPELASQIEIFPEGQICITYDGKIVAMCSSLIITFDDYGVDHTFDDISDNNYIRNHNPKGDTLYGFDMTVHPEYRNMHLGRKLYDERKKICKDFNLERIMFGGRVPNYYKFSDEISIEDYIGKVENAEIYDPVLTFQLRNGFSLKAIMKNYLPEDEESVGNATLMEWRNEDDALDEK